MGVVVDLKLESLDSPTLLQLFSQLVDWRYVGTAPQETNCRLMLS